MAKLIVEVASTHMFCARHRVAVAVVKHDSGKVEFLDKEHEDCHSLLDPSKMTTKQKSEWGI